MINSNAMYRIGAGGALALVIGLGLKVDAYAQQSSGGWQSRLNNIWSRIARDDEDKEPPWGSRGPICAIAPTSPGAETPVIWHDQPVIIWQAGEVAKIALQNAQTEETIWEYVPSASETHVVYGGDPLVAGETYTLALYKFVSAGPTLIPNFQVMQPAMRTLINNGLKNSSIPNDSRISDDEWMAIHQAEYFANRDLDYDAIQALFKVNTPSTDLINIRDDIFNTICTVSEN